MHYRRIFSESLSCLKLELEMNLSLGELDTFSEKKMPNSLLLIDNLKDILLDHPSVHSLRENY